MSDNNSGNRKKSNFPGATAVKDGANLDFFVPGTNFKISYDNFLAGLGVTGTLVQAGNVLATPVLDTQSTVNNIRNLENGAGFKASVSAQNGITLAHNFTVDTVGAPLMLNSTLASPTFPSLLGSSSIAVSQAGNQIKFDVISAGVSTKTVVINQASDFPTAVAGVITLASNTDYFITNDITVSDRFVFADSTQLRAAGTVIITLTYTGTGAMITCEDCDIRILSITLAFPNGSLFNVTSSTAAGIGIVSTQNTVLIGNVLGTAGCRIMSIFLSGIVLTSGGLTLTSTTMDVLSIDSNTWIQFAGTGIDLGTTVLESIQSKNMFLTVSSGVTFINGLANSGNISATGEGVIADIRGTGAGVELGANIDPDDDRWFFVANTRIRNTIRDSLLSVQGNATETLIASEATPVKAAATWTVGRSSGFTGDTTGKVTYDLVTGIVVPITASLTVQKASGGTARVVACIAVNGSVVAQSCIGTDCSSSVSGNITLTWQEELATDDFIEIFLINPTGQGTVNNILVDAVLRVQ